MRTQINYASIATKLTCYLFLYGFLGWGLLFPIAVGAPIIATMKSETDLSFMYNPVLMIILLPLACSIIYFNIRYIPIFALGKVLPSACDQYGLGVFKNGDLIKPKGGQLVGLSWGITWRIVFIKQILMLFVLVLPGSLQFPYAVLTIFMSVFLASMWILKRQYGTTTINYK